MPTPPPSSRSGQVFASVGNSTVYAFDPASGDQVATLQDDTDEPYTAGSAFDANGNFYVTDDINGDISEFSPTGAPLPTFATGLSNPLSIVFDNSGNMYVGQQSTPYIAEFASDGTRLPDIGPLQTELYGDDWIDLSSDECTFYYTTEGTDILTLQQVHQHAGTRFQQGPISLSSIRRPASPSTPSSSRSLPTAMCWSPTRTPSSCWIRTGT